MGQRRLVVELDRRVELGEQRLGRRRPTEPWSRRASCPGARMCGPGRQREGRQLDGVDQPARERLRRLRDDLLDHPAGDRDRVLLQRVAQDPGAQRGALGHVQEDVAGEVAHLQPAVLVVRLLEAALHLHHLHGVLDRLPADRCGERAEGAGHHLADVAAGVDVVRGADDRVHGAQVAGQRGDRAGLEPAEPTGGVDRPLEVERSAPARLRLPGTRGDRGHLGVGDRRRLGRLPVRDRRRRGRPRSGRTSWSRRPGPPPARRRRRRRPGPVARWSGRR